MRTEDATQVTEIDREAFPTMWPTPNYERELKNEMAHYLVVYQERPGDDPPSPVSAPPQNSGWLWRLRHLFHLSPGTQRAPGGQDHILGFAGFWLMAGEAHITSIAVREEERGKGFGEELIVGLTELALELHARVLTLEVRLSNTVAQSLYTKYGFARVGLRRGYYSDNKEDAVIMTTDEITTDIFQAQFQRLKQAHTKKWSSAEAG